MGGQLRAEAGGGSGKKGVIAPSAFQIEVKKILFPLSFPLLFLLLLTPPPISASSNFLGKGGRRKEERRRNTEGLEEKKEKRSNYVFLSILPPLGKRVFLFDILFATDFVPQLHSRFLFETSFFRP